jgi:dipeptidase D
LWLPHFYAKPQGKVNAAAGSRLGIQPTTEPCMTANRIDRILELFEQISRIPRCSKNEEAVTRWFEDWARHRGWPARRDPAGNLLIRVPASPGCERAPAVALQGHLDMVCEKMPQSAHDFTRDPIRVLRDGDWLHAEATTLGADNGVALALGAAVAEDAELRRPRLELLFTVDEETGLTGAKNLPPGLLDARTLINLDSEAEGVFTVGCAGGRDVQIHRDLQLTPPPAGWRWMQLTVAGLCGGHSGIDIHRQRANANQLLARTLQDLMPAGELRLAALSGGTRRNAIPRDARAVVACLPEAAEGLTRRTARCAERFRGEFPSEPALALGLSELPADTPPQAAMTPEAAALVLNLLLALPHGVAQMAPGFADLVHTSSNLAVVATVDRRLEIATSQRSLSPYGLDAASDQVRAAAALAGARTLTESEYPPWTPNLASPLLGRCRAVYRSLYRREPEVRALHAGLECALIGRTYPEMDMISIGPTTENAHSPTERLNGPSLARIAEFLSALLTSLTKS